MHPMQHMSPSMGDPLLSARQVDPLLSAIEVLESENAGLKSQLDDLRIIHHKSRDEAVEQQRKEERAHIDYIKRANLVDNERLEIENARLMRELDHEGSHKNALKRELDSLRAGSSQKKDDLAADSVHENEVLQLKVSQLTKEMSSLKATNDATNEKLRDLQSAGASQRAESVQVRTEMADGRDKLAALQNQIARQQAEIAQSELSAQNADAAHKTTATELARLQQLQQSPSKPLAKPGLGLDESFEFGERVYTCTISKPGVGYRNSPAFGDKNPNGSGPVAGQSIRVDAIVQGPQAVFVRDAVNGLWLPLTDPSGSRQCMAHVGRVDDLTKAELDAMVWNEYKDKVAAAKRDDWFEEQRKKEAQR